MKLVMHNLGYIRIDTYFLKAIKRKKALTVVELKRIKVADSRREIRNISLIKL